MSGSSEPDAETLRLLERQWQDTVGHALLDKPFEQPGSALVFERQFERIIGALQGLPAGPILDVGCGRGQLLARLARTPLGRGRLLVGVDVSVAVRALPERGLAGVRADGERLPFRDGSLAALVYNGALHHMVDYRGALREALRVLGPGGRLIVFEPVSSAFSRAVHRALDPIVFRASCEYESPVDRHLKHAFLEQAVVDVILESGAALSRQTSDFLAYPFTGCYAGAWFTRSERFMRALLEIERKVENTPLLASAARLLAWRFLLVAHKPGEAAALNPGARLGDLLRCPSCAGALAQAPPLRCDSCGVEYPMEGSVPVLFAGASARLSSAP